MPDDSACMSGIYCCRFWVNGVFPASGDDWLGKYKSIQGRFKLCIGD